MSSEDLFWFWIRAIILVGVIGIGVVIGILACWRRHNLRLRRMDARRRERAPKTERGDIWQEGGQRYIEAFGPTREDHAAEQDQPFTGQYDPEEDEDEDWRGDSDDEPDNPFNRS